MEIVPQLTAAAAVLILLAATRWWLRRRGLGSLIIPRKGGGSSLESIARLPLGPQQTLHLVRVGERVVLLASGPSGCALLQNLTWQELASSGERRQ